MSLRAFPVLVVHLLPYLTITSGCMYPSHHWGDWNDSQLLPTIQKLMKGYNRYLRPNFNGKIVNHSVGAKLFARLLSAKCLFIS